MGNWFSNFIPFDQPIILHGVSFRTPEHLYQALKATNIEDVIIIAACETPGNAKRLGYKIKCKSDWNEIKVDCMEYVIDKQFTITSIQGQKLINSKGLIVELNYWHDNFWGDCTCKKCENIKGQNNLGKILERKREELINKIFKAEAETGGEK